MEKEICECKRDYKSPLSGICELCWDEKYPDEKETLEEAAERYIEDSSHALYELRKECFLDGAKWQAEKMYSEEDMIEFAIWVYLEIGSSKNKERTNKELFKEWFEQFKKK